MGSPRFFQAKWVPHTSAHILTLPVAFNTAVLHCAMLSVLGVDRVVAVDLHCGQIQGFFGPRVPVDNLDGGVIGVGYFGDTDLHNPGEGLVLYALEMHNSSRRVSCAQQFFYIHG